MNGTYQIGALFAVLALWLCATSCKDQTKPGAPGGGASLHMGKTESRDSMSSGSSSSTSGDHTAFSARHVLFVDESGHPLMEKVVPYLTNALKAFPQVERLDVAV